MIIQQQSNIAITTMIQYTKHPYHAFTPLPSTLTQASSSYRARVFRGVYVCFSSPIFRCIRSPCPNSLAMAATTKPGTPRIFLTRSAATSLMHRDAPGRFTLDCIQNLISLGSGDTDRKIGSGLRSRHSLLKA